jgi:predicted DNA-binding protein YlxM (UPF0122 family)
MAKDLNMCVLLDIYGGLITEKQAEIMDYYYNQDFSLAEISEHLNITRQGVRDAIKRAEQALSECEEKLKLSDKYESNRIITKRIDKILEEIDKLNKNELKSSSLKKLADDLSESVKALKE